MSVNSTFNFLGKKILLAFLWGIFGLLQEEKKKGGADVGPIHFKRATQITVGINTQQKTSKFIFLSKKWTGH